MTTSAYAMAIQEKLNKERTWTERWKREDASTWEERALSREGHTGVVTDKRAYSPRVRTTLDFDRELRGKSGYRRPKLVEELPSGSTRFVVQPPATPRQPWTTRTWTPIALPPLAATPQPPAEPSAGDAKGVDVDTIHAHLRQLAKLFAHPQLGDEARHEFGELQKLLPVRTALAPCPRFASDARRCCASAPWHAVLARFHEPPACRDGGAAAAPIADDDAEPLPADGRLRPRGAAGPLALPHQGQAGGLP